MIIEDGREFDAPTELGREAPIPDIKTVKYASVWFQNFLVRFRNIKDKEAYVSLQNALVDYLWEKYSNAIIKPTVVIREFREWMFPCYY